MSPYNYQHRYDTNVVTFRGNGTGVILNTGGFQTAETRFIIQEALSLVDLHLEADDGYQKGSDTPIKDDIATPGGEISSTLAETTGDADNDDEEESAKKKKKDSEAPVKVLENGGIIGEEEDDTVKPSPKSSPKGEVAVVGASEEEAVKSPHKSPVKKPSDEDLDFGDDLPTFDDEGDGAEKKTKKRNESKKSEEENLIKESNEKAGGSTGSTTAAAAEVEKKSAEDKKEETDKTAAPAAAKTSTADIVIEKDPKTMSQAERKEFLQKKLAALKAKKAAEEKAKAEKERAEAEKLKREKLAALKASKWFYWFVCSGGCQYFKRYSFTRAMHVLTSASMRDWSV